MWACRWCDAGTHLILYGYHGSERAHRCSTYKDVQLLDSFTNETRRSLEAASAGAAVLLFRCENGPNLAGIYTYSRDGRQLAQHLPCVGLFRCYEHTFGWQDESLLAMSMAGDTLHVCSPSGCLQIISLDRPAAQTDQVCVSLASSCNGLAAVCIHGWRSEVVFVDLAKQHVTCRHALPGSMNVQVIDFSFLIAQCSRSVAISYDGHGVAAETRVISNTGTGLFVVHHACSPSWDLLGSFLAVLIPAGLSVYSITGDCLATVTLRPAAGNWRGAEMQWLPESSQLSIGEGLPSEGADPWWQHRLCSFLPDSAA